MKYTIQPEIFEMFPNFRRGVLIALEVDNATHDVGPSAVLSRAASACLEQESNEDRLRVWDDAYRKFGSDPTKYTPSIRFLHQRVERGKPPRSINKLVDLFNSLSLIWTVPCGGDDLESISCGEICLGFAHGDETFSPLFKPNRLEHPEPGEVIYFSPGSKQVLCRRWTWRNSDLSKITERTKSVAINIDMMMPPFTENDLCHALEELRRQVQRFCGGRLQTQLLSPTKPSFDFEV